MGVTTRYYITNGGIYLQCIIRYMSVVSYVGRYELARGLNVNMQQMHDERRMHATLTEFKFHSGRWSMLILRHWTIYQ